MKHWYALYVFLYSYEDFFDSPIILSDSMSISPQRWTYALSFNHMDEWKYHNGRASCKLLYIWSPICSLPVKIPKASHSHGNHKLSDIQTNWHWEIYEWHWTIMSLHNNWVNLQWRHVWHGAMAAQHNTMLWKFRNDHAPEKTKTVKMKQTMPWYNDEIKGFKRNRGKAESRWLQHRDDSITNATYREECRLVRNRYRSPIDKAKTEY